MSKKEKNVVSYVAGVTLDGPVIVTHVLEEKKIFRPQESVARKGKPATYGKKNINRRHGHPHKEDRVAYQANAQKRGKK